VKPTRLSLYTLLCGAALAGLSCGESTPLGVDSQAPKPEAELNGLLAGQRLLRCSPLPAASASGIIGPAGGVLQVGPHTLSVPPGALTAPVTITAVAPSDTVRRVHFDPAGLSFAQPVYLTMSYANCGLFWWWVPKRIAYTSDLLQILEYLPSFDSQTSQTVIGRLLHFSQYAVAW